MSGFELRRWKTIGLGYISSAAVATSLLTLVFFQITSFYTTPNDTIRDFVYVWALMGF